MITIEGKSPYEGDDEKQRDIRLTPGSKFGEVKIWVKPPKSDNGFEIVLPRQAVNMFVLALKEVSNAACENAGIKERP